MYVRIGVQFNKNAEPDYYQIITGEGPAPSKKDEPPRVLDTEQFYNVTALVADSNQVVCVSGAYRDIPAQAYKEAFTCGKIPVIPRTNHQPQKNDGPL